MRARDEYGFNGCLGFIALTASPPANDSALPFVEAIGTVCQSLMIALLILVVNTRRKSETSTDSNKRVIAAVGVACLIGYLALRVVYFTTPITPMLLLMMAVLPSAYFICVGLYLENYLSLIPATLFALIYIATTAISFSS
ncbi:MAG: hypothetical protein ABI137_08640 [Antricoccus sp.]